MKELEIKLEDLRRQKRDLFRQVKEMKNEEERRKMQDWEERMRYVCFTCMHISYVNIAPCICMYVCTYVCLCVPYSRKGWRGIYFGELVISVSTAKV